MKIADAIREITRGTKAGIRGPGCAAIEMADGRVYTLACEHSTPMLERYSPEGDLIEQKPAESVDGTVRSVSWSCDELGGIYVG